VLAHGESVNLGGDTGGGIAVDVGDDDASSALGEASR
jgi:hypothetical protein